MERMRSPDMATFRLISRTTTTGWWDWEHGELWLGSNGLLRRRRGWSKTLASVGLVQDLLAAGTDPSMRERLTIEEIDAAVERGGLWIPADTIQRARLRAGIMTGRLSLSLARDDSAKLLWAKSSVTYQSLRDALAKWLGGRMQLD